MNGVTVQLESVSIRSSLKKCSSIVPLVLIFGYLAIWACTRAHFMADTNAYALSILRHQHGGASLDYRLLTSNPFWDFGHLLWRPLGWFCFVIVRPATELFASQNERAQVILTLIGINFVTALVCVFFFFRLARLIVGNNWVALLATFGLLSADAFLNYAHSGASYGVGLACLVMGMYLSFRASISASTWIALGAGLMFALSALFWFPYAFVIPAAIATPLLVGGYDYQRLRLATTTLIACVTLGLAAYSSAILGMGIRSATELKQWVLSAGHGQIQPGGTRAVARLAFSVPRSFTNMDRDGMWLKRYLVHDPYAPVSAGVLVRLSLWKLAMFYLLVGIIGIELLRSTPGRRIFFWLGLAVVPILIFAVFIFEAGSIERYLPLYPFFFLACGYVFYSEYTKLAFKIVLILILIVTAVVNINAMRVSTLESQKVQAVARIHDLIPSLGNNTLLIAINEQDNLAEFRHNFPLDEININRDWQTYDLVEVNAARLTTWGEDFAQRVVAIWRRGGKVWLPARVLHSEPNPEWNWVEGDDKRVKWPDLPLFFSQLDAGPLVSGEDGFVLLQESPKNKQILGAIYKVGGKK